MKPYTGAFLRGAAALDRQAFFVSFKYKYNYQRRRSSTKCPFEILGIATTASPEQVKTAFVTLALQYHPDTSQASSAERFNQIRQAFESIQGGGKHQIEPTTGPKVVRQHDSLHTTVHLDAATRREVAKVANMSHAGLDKGGMWDFARMIAQEEKESPVQDDPLLIQGGITGRKMRRKR